MPFSTRTCKVVMLRYVLQSCVDATCSSSVGTEVSPSLPQVCSRAATKAAMLRLGAFVGDVSTTSQSKWSVGEGRGWRQKDREQQYKECQTVVLKSRPNFSKNDQIPDMKM